MNNRFFTVLAYVSLGCVVLPLQAANNDAADATLRAAKQTAEKASRAPFIPRDDFLTRASIREVSMSPDGRWLAYRKDTGQELELMLQEISSGKEHRIMSDSARTDLHWSGDGALVWLPDDKGLGVFDIATMTGRRIFRFDDARQQSFWTVNPNATDVALLREKVPAEGEWLYRYLAIDARGKTHIVHETRMALQSVLLDAEGKLRYAAGYDGAAFDTVIWKFEGGNKEELMRCPLPEQCRPVAWHDDTVWALAHNGNDRMSLQKHDGSGEWQTLHSDPRGISDAASVIMQPNGKDWFATAYRPDRVEWHGRTKEADAKLAQPQQKIPGANLDFGMSNDGKRWLVQAKKGSWPYDRYYLYDVTEQTLSLLFEEERRSALNSDHLADSMPVHWQGKDGMALHGYVYPPKGVPLETAPLIATVHGGPYNRSKGEYDIESQLLVNRGYVVFKPNFRASTGYGVNYVTATEGNFGKHGVLDDILTGLDHLIANGIGDADKQAIIGHSFGGYASLLAVTYYPERFAFAVPSAAPVDMAWTMEEINVEGGSAMSADGPPVDVLFPGYGVPYGDPAWHERMHRDSPMAHAVELRTPVYLWAGARDDRVAVESLARYYAEANADFTPALLIDPDSGHSPRERLNVEALAWLIEAAADKHFGGGVTPPSPVLQRFLEKNLRAGKTVLLEQD